MAELAVCAATPAQLEEAAALALNLGLPLIEETAGAAFPLLLWLSGERLELRESGTSTGPVYVDFAHGAADYRRKHRGREPLARAVGYKPATPPEVLDATAGLGRDAFMLAALGCRLRLIERSPVAAALLADGLRRAALHEDTAPIAARMQLIRADAVEYLRQLAEAQRPAVIYLDPMYPERRKSALVKKEMRLFRRLVGEDQDADALLQAALQAARRRVVVKRPRHAPPLAGQPPSFTLSSENTRYDVYAGQ